MRLRGLPDSPYRSSRRTLLLGGLLFGFGVSVTSDAKERVPSGGELALFEAVGRLGPDLLLFCRSSPVGDVWRDLIDAWQRLQQAVSAGCPSVLRTGGRGQ
jgi:hypothetical protein